MRKGLKRWLMKVKKIYPTESKLHESVAQLLHLRLHESVIWTTVENSNQQGGVAGVIKQAKLKKKGVKAGWPDIQIFWHSDYYANFSCIMIELKSQTGPVQKHQTALHKELKAKLGVPTFICRSIDDVEKVLIDESVPLKNVG